MNNDWPALAESMTPALRELRAGVPDVMNGFAAIARGALAGGTLDIKTKELIALGIAVAIRCDACVAFHAEAAVKRGATRAEMMEAMGMAVYMGAGPSVMYAAKAVEAFDQFMARAGSVHSESSFPRKRESRASDEPVAPGPPPARG